MKRIVTLLLFSVLSISVQAQYDERGKLFEQLSLNIGGSVSIAPGLRFEAATPIASRLSLRASLIYFPETSSASYSEKLKIDDPKIKAHVTAKNADPAIRFSSQFSSFSSQLLVDFTPAKDGLFHLTAGFFFGGSNANIQANLVNLTTGGSLIKEIRDNGYNDEIPVLQHNKMRLKFNDDGSMSGNLFFGNFVKPYFGLGLGRSIPRNRIGFKAEFGLLRIGGLKLSSDNILDKNNKKFDKQDIGEVFGKGQEQLSLYEKYTEWSPLLSLMLTIRLM